MNMQERIEKFVTRDPNSGCWLWTGSADLHGYGRIAVNRKNRHAHRISYEAHVGPIADGLQIDHLCRVRCCVNPAHLEPVSQQENIRRGDRFSKGKYNRSKTHCKHGHEFTEDNTYRLIVKAGPVRICKTCHNNRRNSCEVKS